MRFLTSLLFKTALSSMILTAPAMINVSKKDAVFGASPGKEDALTYNSSAVIKRFVNYTHLTSRAIFSEEERAILPEETWAIHSEERRVDDGENNSVANNAMTAGNVVTASDAVTAKALSVEAKKTLAMEVKMVIDEADVLYDSMALEQSGLNEEAFEYAWRGYHNLLK